MSTSIALDPATNHVYAANIEDTSVTPLNGNNCNSTNHKGCDNTQARPCPSTRDPCRPSKAHI
jgi:hypothetical protein